MLAYGFVGPLSQIAQVSFAIQENQRMAMTLCSQRKDCVESWDTERIVRPSWSFTTSSYNNFLPRTRKGSP